MATTINSSSLDFQAIKNNLKTYLKQQSEFKDYDFEASGLVDKTKGSIFQFISYFPGDEGLLSLANSVTETLRNEEYNNVEIPEF